MIAALLVGILGGAVFAVLVRFTKWGNPVSWTSAIVFGVVVGTFLGLWEYFVEKPRRAKSRGPEDPKA